MSSKDWEALQEVSDNLTTPTDYDNFVSKETGNI